MTDPNSNLDPDLEPPPSKVSFSVKEIAKQTGVSRSLIYNEWKRGRGPRRTRVGKRVLVTAEARDEWLKARHG